MFPISTTFRQLLRSRIGRNRVIVWWGVLTLASGSVHTFDADDIMQGTGEITSTCDLPCVGGAYSAMLRLQLYTSIELRLLKNAIIDIYVRLNSSATVDTWDDAANFLWSEISSREWDDSEQSIFVDIPMGRFKATNVTREINSIKIEAYDNMLKLDKTLPAMDTSARTPFDWLRWICTSCGIELGMSSADTRALINGKRSLTYADVNEDVTTYRGLLSHLAAALGSIAVIDRTGKLKLIRQRYDTDFHIDVIIHAAVARLTSDDRFSSEFSDQDYYYTGLAAQYKAGATQEYRRITELIDDGLIIDLGINPFLQIANSGNRITALSAIIESFRDMVFTPYTVTAPFDPTYDLLDILVFSGGHAPISANGPLTSISRRINGAMTLQCATPEETQELARETIQIDGVSSATTSSGEAYASNDFWIVIDSFPDDEATIDNSDALTTELTVNCTVDDTTTQIAWTGAYTLDEDAIVTITISVDGETIYELADEQTAGQHVLNATTGYEIKTRGEHYVKVFLREDAI